MYSKYLTKIKEIKSIHLLIIIIVFFLMLLNTITSMHQMDYNFINYFTVLSNDNGELFLPADNFVEFGNYSTDGVTPYTDRIPGISLLFMMLRFFFNTNTSFTVLVSISVISYLLTIIYFYLTLSSRMKQLFAFILSLALLLITPYQTLLGTKPESYSLIFILIGFIFLYKGINLKRNILISGFFIMMAVTFRGFLIPKK